MAAYKDLVGQKITKVTSNPGEPKTGQMWYNSTTGSLRGLGVVEAFSSAAPLSTGRASAAGAGTQTAALYNGGSPDTNKCENYNGTGWTSIANLNNALQYAGGCGTETSALIYGDYPVANTTEEFNGSSWSAQEGFSTARRSGASFGLETAAVLAGGTTGPAVSTATEEYNGEAWTGSGALSQARQYFAGTGIETAGLVFGGSSNPNTTIYANTEEYNGSSWTNGGALPASRSMMFSWGTQTAGALSGGALPSTTATCLKYDGTSWASSPASMGTATKQGYTSGVGTAQSAGLCAGGDPGVARTEEFNISTNTITAAAWASGGAMTTARSGLASAGTQTANVFIGGQMSNSPYAPLNTVELYNGTTWSNNPNNAPYSASNNCGTGTQTAALSWGGYPNVSTTLEFDGSSFSTGGSLSTGRELTSNNIGVQTAAVAAGGYQRSPDVYPTQSEEYNGTAWTAGGDINTPRYGSAGAGTETAGVISGGIEPGQLSATEEYNGSSWTTVNARPYSAGNAGTSGTQTDSLVYGGNPGGKLTTTLGYDGTNWSTRPSMSTARAMMGSSAGGTSTAALASSGTTSTATEEFTGETSAANITDFTTS
jgi:hypothetical protein